jgi:hypothetical protein
MRSILNGTTPSVQDQPLIAVLNLTGILSQFHCQGKMP